MASVEKSTLYGGKPAPTWSTTDFELPGYQNARIIFTNISTNQTTEWGFLISPSALSVTFNNDIQANKTMAGWLIMRNGPQLGTLTISGFFLDTLYAPERMRFLDEYMSKVVDEQNSQMEFITNYFQKILIEGTFYHGVIQSLSMSKSSQSQFTYQYSITMMFYKQTSAYSIDSSKSMGVAAMKNQMGLGNSATSKLDSTANKNISISDGVMSILTR